MKKGANKTPLPAQDRVQTMGKVPTTPQDYLNEIRVDKSTQPRVIVTTDGECDDQNSLRHMLLYANDMDIAGLIYTAAQFHFQGDGVHTLKEITPHFRCEEEGAGDLMSFRPMEVDEDGQGGWIHDVIKNDYTQDYIYLSQNDPNYPTPEYLLSVTKLGNVLFEGDVRFETEGSNLIRDAILDDDPRLLYLQAWGGNNTIVRALMSIHERYKDSPDWEDIRKKVCGKVVFQRGFNQDNAWDDNNISELFPDIRIMTADNLDMGYSGPDTPWRNLAPFYRAGFLLPNIKTGHGAMMANYHLMNDGAYFPNDPDNMQYGRLTVIDWGFVVMQRETYDFMGEGDSIHWIPMISVGLRGLESPESFNYGSWAGRFTWQTVSGKRLHQPDWDREYDYVMGRAGGTTTWDGNYDGFSGKRFGEQFFHDWVGRAGWTVNGFETANHPPVVRVEQLDMTASAGDVVDLYGCAYDPDGDTLKIKWWVYEAGGSYSGCCTGLRVWHEDRLATKFTVPVDAKSGDYFNIILEVTDHDGEPDSFTRYAQVIVAVP